MRSTAVLLVALSLAVAGQASAAATSDHLTDVDYLKANRCRGLAEGFGVSSASSLDSLIKTEGRNRLDIVYAKGQEELARGKRDAAKTDGKERYEAELNGYCTAFLGARDAASTR
ncbi:hypothetical protein [Phenylobacterium sp.]|uniref:hypothetical protein n=1 Tax=Phenylobacterium sp. TaxID=1871053 RepID=UPI00122677A5|nr:hypothetical protein [Phenylobacterium sp.]THD53041.1 MAG: hypothetical protein E8A12_19060 [Phenylobacterium sp.]